MKSIKLVVVYNARVISIPFKNVALIDEFTTYYDDNKDIGIALNEILRIVHKNRLYNNKKLLQKKKKKAYNTYKGVAYEL